MSSVSSRLLSFASVRETSARRSRISSSISFLSLSPSSCAARTASFFSVSACFRPSATMSFARSRSFSASSRTRSACFSAVPILDSASILRRIIPTPTPRTRHTAPAINAAMTGFMDNTSFSSYSQILNAKRPSAATSRTDAYLLYTNQPCLSRDFGGFVGGRHSLFCGVGSDLLLRYPVGT